VDDAVEDQRVALLVAALEVEDPGHWGVVGRLAERVRCSATASSATRKPARRVVRRSRRSSASSAHARASGRGRWHSHPTAGGPRCARRRTATAGRENMSRLHLFRAQTSSCGGIEREIPRLPKSHPGTIPSRIRASVGVPACLEPPYQDFAPGPASLRISDSDERGPGQCSSIISSPPPRRIARNVRATTTASSS